MPSMQDIMLAAMQASDAGEEKVGFYKAAIINASRGKRGITTIRVGVKVAEFTPNDVLDGMHAYLVLGTAAKLQEIQAKLTAEGK